MESVSPPVSPVPEPASAAPSDGDREEVPVDGDREEVPVDGDREEVPVVEEELHFKARSR